ncbi:TetR/AcrR family transcriptional regulator [Nocardioides sp. BYT-33-1]|uniref:TetR/AcrR family transcriptional regulator n=1 Tax=Nocardioides sp. BYT-33-1 TaxID=3416952 RepID=UPI003F535D4D
MTTTRARLLDATLRVVADQGIAKASARSIATEAEVNQALVFYHFGSVDELLAAACLHGAEQRVAAHRTALEGVRDIPGLVAVAHAVHATERAEGTVALLGQLLAGASSHPALADATRQGLDLWIVEVERVLRRLIAPTVLADLVDVPGLARAIGSGFVGLELYEGVDGEGAAAAFGALEQLAAVLAAAEDLGPLERTAVRRRVRRAAAR